MNFLKKVESKLIEYISTRRYLPIQLDITNSCNLSCIHCYHPNHSNEGAISLADWEAIIDDYIRLTTKLFFKPLIVLGGGEPTASRIFHPLIEYIYRNYPDTYLVVISNGTLLSQKLLAPLKKFEKVLIQISIDGPDSKRHDSVRGMGSFEKTMKGIKFLKESNVNFQLLAVLSLNSSAWIEEFFKLAKEIKPISIGFTRLILNGTAANLDIEKKDRPLLPLELRDTFIKIVNFSAKYLVKTHINSPLFNLIYPGLGRNGRFWEAIVVDHKGNYLSSSRTRLRLGDFRSMGMEKFFLTNDLMEKLRRGEIEKCGSCIHFDLCGGDRNAAFAGSGNFLGRDPGCWI